MELVLAYFPNRWGIGLVYTPLAGYSCSWKEEGMSEEDGGILASGTGYGLIGYRELYRQNGESPHVIQASLRGSYMSWDKGSGAALSKDRNAFLVQATLGWNIQFRHFLYGLEGGVQYQWMDDVKQISIPFQMSIGVLF